MDSLGKSKKAMITVLCWILVSAILQGCFADVPHFWNNTPSNSGSSLVLPLTGNVRPLEYYSVPLKIGPQPRPFAMDIDTGSDLTWVECNYPCKGCIQSLYRQYKPHDNFVRCGDPDCDWLRKSERLTCENPQSPCRYKVKYAEGTTSRGVLVRDSISLKLRNGTVVTPSLTFGCAYDQKYSKDHRQPDIDGLLGLGKRKVSILSQLIRLGVIRNVVGHCLSSERGGFLFIGDELVPSSGIDWVPMSTDVSLAEEYAAGPAELFHNGNPTGVEGLQVLFDSGSAYTYFNPKDYQVVLDQVKADLVGKPLKQAPAQEGFDICWKGAKRFRSVDEVKKFFVPFALSFLNRNHRLQMPPEAYLIISHIGHVCLGILKTAEQGLGDFTLVGDISMQNLMVIYDNEQNRMGWVSEDCRKF